MLTPTQHPAPVPKFKIRAVNSFGLGLLLCILCALFPPRQTSSSSAPRVFLFSPDIHHLVSGDSKNPQYYACEIDAGRLLAELVLICGASGIFTLYFCLEYWQDKGEEIWTQSG